MLKDFIRFFKRPTLGANDTSNLVYQRSNQYPVLSIGGAGELPLGSLAATYPMGITPGPTRKLNDASVTGVINGTFTNQPLLDEATRNV